MSAATSSQITRRAKRPAVVLLDKIGTLAALRDCLAKYEKPAPRSARSTKRK